MRVPGTSTPASKVAIIALAIAAAVAVGFVIRHQTDSSESPADLIENKVNSLLADGAVVTVGETQFSEWLRTSERPLRSEAEGLASTQNANLEATFYELAGESSRSNFRDMDCFYYPVAIDDDLDTLGIIARICYDSSDPNAGPYSVTGSSS